MIKLDGLIFADVQDRRSVGKVGAFILSNEGDMLALTTIDVLFGNTVYTELSAVDGGDRPPRISVGKRLNRFCRPLDSENQAISMLGWFSVDAIVDEKNIDLMPTSFVEEPPTCFGIDVYFLGETERAGYVRSTNLSARFEHPHTPQARVFHGLIEVSRSGNPRAFARPGDGGSAIYTEDGFLIGLVVGLLENSALVAPVADLMRAEKFQLADRNSLTTYNTQFSNQTVPDKIEEFTRKITQSPHDWAKTCADTRNELNALFDREYRLFGAEQMGDVQDHLALLVYRTVETKDLITGLLEIRIENDAPGSFANENWLWRSLIERWKVLRVEVRGSEISLASGNVEMSFPLDELNRRRNVSSPLSVEARIDETFGDDSEDALADHLLGQSAILTDGV